MCDTGMGTAFQVRLAGLAPGLEAVSYEVMHRESSLTPRVFFNKLGIMIGAL